MDLPTKGRAALEWAAHGQVRWLQGVWERLMPSGHTPMDGTVAATPDRAAQREALSAVRVVNCQLLSQGKR